MSAKTFTKMSRGFAVGLSRLAVKRCHLSDTNKLFISKIAREFAVGQSRPAEALRYMFLGVFKPINVKPFLRTMLVALTSAILVRLTFSSSHLSTGQS